MSQFTFYYYNQDHLGRSAARSGVAFIVQQRKNIREVVDANGTVQQVTN